MKVTVPLSNLFAFRAADRGRLAAVERRLVESRRYHQVLRPHPDWVLAIAPLSGSRADTEYVPEGGFAFAEGRGLGKDLMCEQADLARCPGDFSYFRFHPDGSATPVRSCAGTVPVYFARCGDGFALSTQCDALIRFAGVGTGLDALAAATWTMGLPGFFSNRTHLAGVQGLMPGERVTVTAAGFTVSRYWMPLVSQQRRSSAAQVLEHQQRLRTYLLGRLEQDLDPGGQNLLTLSGGVDSSALLALAGGALKIPTMTWSLVPPASAPKHARELSYIEPLRESAGVTRHWQTEVTEQNLEDLIPQAPPIPFPVLHPALCSLGALTRETAIKVMLGGEFADEICGARLSTPDWAAGTSVWELMTAPGRWPFGRSAPARWLKGRALNVLGRSYLVHPQSLPAYCPPGLQDEYRQFVSDLRHWINSLPVQHRYLFTRQQTIDFAPQNWEACSYYGIRRSIPFLSREMIELTLECHPSELIGPNTKRLLRGALHNDVPHRNLYRPDKGDFGLRFVGVKRPIADLGLDDDQFWGELEAIVSPQWRRAVVEQGWIDFGDKVSLLYLKTLKTNLDAAAFLPAPKSVGGRELEAAG